MRRRTFLAGAASIAAAAVAGCGLPEDDRPRLIGADEAPRDLSPQTSAPASDGGDAFVDVYFVRREDNLLVPVRRRVPSATVRSAVEALLMGLGETSETLSSSIPRDTVLLDARQEGDVVVLDLGPPEGGGITAVVGTAQIQAFAQLVLTATAIEGVTAVRFTVAGNPLAVTVAGGAQVAPGEAVRAGDYATLLAEG